MEEAKNTQLVLVFHESLFCFLCEYRRDDHRFFASYCSGAYATFRVPPSIPHTSVFCRGRYINYNVGNSVSKLTREFNFSCKRYNLFRQIVLIVTQVLVCSKFPNLFQSVHFVHQNSTVLQTLRIYALYGCSLRILILMVGSGGILFVVSLVRSSILDI